VEHSVFEIASHHCPDDRGGRIRHLQFPDERQPVPRVFPYRTKEEAMIRKLASGEYRLYSRKTDSKTGKRKNLGTFKTRAAAEKHEREVQYFKRAG
jgi:hypothetical protein